MITHPCTFLGYLGGPSGGHMLCVVNTHILCDPGSADVKLWQACLSVAVCFLCESKVKQSWGWRMLHGAAACLSRLANRITKVLVLISSKRSPAVQVK